MNKVNLNQEKKEEVKKIPAPDGGYAWVVLAAAFVRFN